MTSYSQMEEEEEEGDSSYDDYYGNSSILQLNPLLIPHVAKQILHYCTHSSLKTSRLVCKLWKEVATDQFSKESKIRFYNFQHIDTFMSADDIFYLQNLQNHHHRLMTSLSSYCLSPSLCRNVCLHGQDFQEWVILLKPFFSKFGSHIKSLDISHGIGDVTEDFMLQIAQHIDSLEELSISGTTVMYSDSRYIDGGGGFQFYPILPSVKRLNLKLPVTCFKRWSDVRTFFTDFFSLFPNVEGIKFIGCQFPELFKYLPEEIRFPRLKNVHLQLLSSEGLNHFITRGFPLSKITLDIEPLLGLNNLHAFLEAFANTLTNLDMTFHFKGEYNYSHNATGFPSSRVLKRLRTLRLYGFWGSLYFLNDFQSLTKATVEKMKWDVAFPEGTDKINKECRKCLRFFDENGAYHEL